MTHSTAVLNLVLDATGGLEGPLRRLNSTDLGDLAPLNDDARLLERTWLLDSGWQTTLTFACDAEVRDVVIRTASLRSIDRTSELVWHERTGMTLQLSGPMIAEINWRSTETAAEYKETIVHRPPKREDRKLGSPGEERRPEG